MIVSDAELTPYGELFLGNQDEECEFCGRSMISRFGGIVATNECPSCRADFHRLNDAGKLEIESAPEGMLVVLGEAEERLGL